MPDDVGRPRLGRRVPLPKTDLLLKRGHVLVRLHKGHPGMRIVRGNVFEKTFVPGKAELVPQDVWERWLIQTGQFELVKQ